MTPSIVSLHEAQRRNQATVPEPIDPQRYEVALLLTDKQTGENISIRGSYVALIRFLVEAGGVTISD